MTRNVARAVIPSFSKKRFSLILGIHVGGGNGFVECVRRTNGKERCTVEISADSDKEEIGRIPEGESDVK